MGFPAHGFGVGRALRARLNASPLRSAARGAAGPPPSSVRLLLPLCPRSVSSVTKSAVRFCVFCASSRPTLRRPRSGRPTPATCPPPSSVLSVCSCTKPSECSVCSVCSVGRPPPLPTFSILRPSPASSVSALRGLCDTLRRPIFAPSAPSAPFARLRGQPSAARGAATPPPPAPGAKGSNRAGNTPKTAQAPRPGAVILPGGGALFPPV